ncbi:MAG: hypothetical protein A2010_00315 [Nitrospirae bacterium GWD2_57_9]|nr:MAG: hypothetical protein A2010_00315 [Nitrospirae bacterium GWD2_57_9]
MRSKIVFLGAALLPLVVIVVLRTFGVSFNAWVYIVLAVACPVAAAIIWFASENIEKRINNAEKETGSRKKSG